VRILMDLTDFPEAGLDFIAVMASGSAAGLQGTGFLRGERGDEKSDDEREIAKAGKESESMRRCYPTINNMSISIYLVSIRTIRAIRTNRPGGPSTCRNVRISAFPGETAWPSL
jgi:hypothetical protein